MRGLMDWEEILMGEIQIVHFTIITTVPQQRTQTFPGVRSINTIIYPRFLKNQ